jgi:hypothetical protein
MGYEGRPPPPGGYGGGYQPQPPRGVFDRLRHHFRNMTGQPQPPMGGGYGGQQFGQGIGQPGAPQPPQTGLNSFQRWIQIHGNSPTARQDYQNWWHQYGMSGATINGESFGGEGNLGDEDLVGGFDMRG